MTSMMLAVGGNVWSYVLLGVLALLMIAMPIFMNQRNKRDTQKIQEQTNSLKVGDKILTTSGVYGTIVELKYDDSQKVVVIETGSKEKSFISIDAYAIYTVFKSDAQLKAEAEAKAENEKKVVEAEQEKPKNKRKKSSLENEVAEVCDNKTEKK